MSRPHTFYWHDYETFGVNARRDRPSQFAGVRTDEDLNEIGEPLMIYCRPSPDLLPHPEACLLTGITPQDCEREGLAEHEFCAAVEEQLSASNTIGVGYNTLKFDDEVTRHLLWRNLSDPYAREWQNGCGRWDLLPLVRMAWALGESPLVWPVDDQGKPSFRLELLSQANGLAHDMAHDALSDVRATIALARLIKQHHPDLWALSLALRDKRYAAEVAGINGVRKAWRPFMHFSSLYGVDSGCMAAVFPLMMHPTNKNEVIVWNLAHDPAELLDLTPEAIRSRLFVRKDELPEGVTRLPMGSIAVNKVPMLLAGDNLRLVSAKVRQRFGLDFSQVQARAEKIRAWGTLLDDTLAEVYTRQEQPAADVDEDLYGGFVANDDRRTLMTIQALACDGLMDHLGERLPSFRDPRLHKLLMRFRARNFEHTLSEEEAQDWAAFVRARLTDPAVAAGGLTLDVFDDLLASLSGQEKYSNARSRAILAELAQHAQHLRARWVPPPA